MEMFADGKDAKCRVGISRISLCSLEILLGPIKNKEIYENFISIEQFI